MPVLYHLAKQLFRLHQADKHFLQGNDFRLKAQDIAASFQSRGFHRLPHITQMGEGEHAAPQRVGQVEPEFTVLVGNVTQ